MELIINDNQYQSISVNRLILIIDYNRYQSISVNRLILIIDDQLMATIRVVIDLY